MANTATIVPSSIEQANLSFVGADGRLVSFQIVAFAVDGTTANPITWPAVPGKSDVYIRTSAGFQRFDLASGLAHGPQGITIGEVQK